jgi:hypothetical protein
MDLNFDRLRKIYLEQGEEGLHNEKLAILSEFVDGLPNDKKQKVIDYQSHIQRELVGLEPEQRLIKLSGMIQESLFDLTNALIDVNTCINGSIEADTLIDKVKRE